MWHECQNVTQGGGGTSKLTHELQRFYWTSGNPVVITTQKDLVKLIGLTVRFAGYGNAHYYYNFETEQMLYYYIPSGNTTARTFSINGNTITLYKPLTDNDMSQNLVVNLIYETN